MRPGDSLLHKTRREILGYLCKYPCSSRANIARHFKMSVATIVWHIRKMETDGIIERKKDRQYNISLPAGFIPEKFRPIYIYLYSGEACASRQEIFKAILAKPGITIQEIGQSVGINYRAVSKSADMLEEIGWIHAQAVGKFRHCFIDDDMLNSLLRFHSEETPKQNFIARMEQSLRKQMAQAERRPQYLSVEVESTIADGGKPTERAEIQAALRGTALKLTLYLNPFALFIGDTGTPSKSVAVEAQRRLKLFEYLCKHPYSYQYALARELGVNQGTIIWHLDKLERAGLIKSEKYGQYAVYCPAAMLPEKRHRDFFKALNGSQDNMGFKVILENPGITQKALANALKISPFTIIRNARALGKQGYIISKKEGKYVRYYLNPTILKELLAFLNKPERQEAFLRHVVKALKATGITKVTKLQESHTKSGADNFRESAKLRLEIHQMHFTLDVCLNPILKFIPGEIPRAEEVMGPSSPRIAILQYLCKYPCSHQAALAKALRVTSSTIAFHNKKLIETGLLESGKYGRNQMYYPTAMLPEKRHRDFCKALNGAVGYAEIQKAFKAIIGNPGITQTELANALKVSYRTVMAYTKALEKQGCILSKKDRQSKHLFPNHENIRDLWDFFNREENRDAFLEHVGDILVPPEHKVVKAGKGDPINTVELSLILPHATIKLELCTNPLGEYITKEMLSAWEHKNSKE